MWVSLGKSLLLLSYRVLACHQLEKEDSKHTFHKIHILVTIYHSFHHMANLSILQDSHNKVSLFMYSSNPFLQLLIHLSPQVWLSCLYIEICLHSIKIYFKLITFMSLCSIFISCKVFKPITTYMNTYQIFFSFMKASLF